MHLPRCCRRRLPRRADRHAPRLVALESVRRDRHPPAWALLGLLIAFDLTGCRQPELWGNTRVPPADLHYASPPAALGFHTADPLERTAPGRWRDDEWTGRGRRECPHRSGDSVGPGAARCGRRAQRWSKRAGYRAGGVVADRWLPPATGGRALLVSSAPPRRRSREPRAATARYAPAACSPARVAVSARGSGRARAPIGLPPRDPPGPRGSWPRSGAPDPPCGRLGHSLDARGCSGHRLAATRSAPPRQLALSAMGSPRRACSESWGRPRLDDDAADTPRPLRDRRPARYRRRSSRTPAPPRAWEASGVAPTAYLHALVLTFPWPRRPQRLPP